MVYLINKKILTILILFMIGLGVNAQSFSYSYIDPCTKEVKNISITGQNGNSPIVMNYYGQVRVFSLTELQNGSFDNWANSVYNNYGKNNPCQEIGVQTITTNVINVSNTVVNNVLSLSSMLNTLTTATSNATNSISNVTNSASSGSLGGNENNSGGGNNNSNNNGDNNQNSGSGNENNSNGSSSSGENKTEKGVEKKEEKSEEQKQEEAKKEEQKQASQSTTKSTSKATTKGDKPAILLTGDLVGLQTTGNNTQDAKATMSYIRINGDRKKSFGVAADFTVNAKIGNVTIFKSWITQKTTRKHIDLVSNSLSLLPNSVSNTLVYIRIDNVKKFTGLYGTGLMYGEMNNEKLTSVIGIGGGMYKGQITKNVDAVFILAAVYIPYMKYYETSLFKTKPLILPFLNLNYKVTKSFRFGLTAGTTYSVNEQIVNYQLLFGAKLTL